MRHRHEGIYRTGGRAILMALAVFLLQPVAAQRQKPTPLTPTPSTLERSGGFSATVEMVRVPVVVIDRRGAFIGDLQQSNFIVEDGGKSHPVAHFVSDTEPATVGIVVDASTTMAPYTDGIRAAVMRAANNLRTDDELFLIEYGTTATTLSPPSTDKSAFALALAGYKPNDSDRALFDAVELGLSTLENATHDKRSLILIGAGADTSSSTGELTLQQDIRRTGVSIHAIVLADRAGPGDHAAPARVNRVQSIPEIVRFTGGLLAQRPANAERFGGVTGWLETSGNDISTYVKHQYLLHYIPLNPPNPGTWRSIRVRLDVAFKQVRARSGYIR